MTGPPPTVTPAQLDEVYARLLDRGFSYEQIAQMTDRQKYDQVGHARDEKGQVQGPLPDADAATPADDGISEKEKDRQALFGVGKMAGVPEEVLWGEWLKKYPEDAHMRGTASG